MEKKRVLIITFSPGGGCAELADAALILLRRSGYSADEIDITLPDDRDAAAGLELHSDLLLAVLPVYFHRLPRPVVDFFSTAQLFAPRSALILGYGSCGTGMAAKEARRLFDRCEVPLFRIMECPLPHSLAFAVDEKQILPDSLGIVGKFVLSAAADSVGEAPPITHRSDTYGFVPQLLAARLTATLPKTDVDACTFCNACARACPTGAITQNQYTVDASRCIRCSACVRACPEGAKSMRVYPWTESYLRRKFAVKRVPAELSRHKKG